MEAKNEAYKILERKILEIWLKAKDESKLISRSILESRNCDTELGLLDHSITIAL